MLRSASCVNAAATYLLTSILSVHMILKFLPERRVQVIILQKYARLISILLQHAVEHVGDRLIARLLGVDQGDHRHLALC